MPPNNACTRPLGERQDCRGGSLCAFACACGKVQAGSLRGLRLVPAKWRCLVPPTSG